MARGAHPYLCAMLRRDILVILLGFGLLTPAVAQPPKRSVAAAGPASIGRYADWTAATDKVAGRTECYAFTRPASSSPALPGRGDVVLTVTERVGLRDAVAISVGFAYPAGAVAAVSAGTATFDFYTAGGSAFARDGHAVATAFQRARQVQVRSPGPKGRMVTDSFGLRGFAAAYAAIQKACPAGRAAS